MQSLFVVSLPRSMSSAIYHICRRSLGLNEPSWTSDGEILNADRFVLLPQPNNDFSKKFTPKCAENDLFKRTSEFLDQIVVRDGYAYKDVVQPFVVADWIKKNRPPTIRLRRNVADVTYSMLQSRWYYPALLSPNIKNLEQAMVRGLLQAQNAHDSIPAVEIEFDHFIHTEEPLHSALKSLYGRRAVNFETYIDKEFELRRGEIMERRSSPRYQSILKLLKLAGQ